MSDQHPAVDIVDDVDHHRFLAVVDGIEALLQYRRNGDRLILVHTEVPEELGGRGIAAALVQFAIDRAAEAQLTVVPWCPYARRWLEQHPDTAARVTIDWTPPPKA